MQVKNHFCKRHGQTDSTLALVSRPPKIANPLYIIFVLANFFKQSKLRLLFLALTFYPWPAHAHGAYLYSAWAIQAVIIYITALIFTPIIMPVTKKLLMTAVVFIGFPVSAQVSNILAGEVWGSSSSLIGVASLYFVTACWIVGLESCKRLFERS